MLRRETSRSYQEFNGDDSDGPLGSCQNNDISEVEQDESSCDPLPDEDIVDNNLMSIAFNKTCLKNVFTAILVLIYLLLTTVAAFLAYQTISDFMEKLNHPVMSVSYKEVEEFAPPGIVLYPGKAQLLSCMHQYHDYIPPPVASDKLEKGNCIIEEVIYYGPYSNQTQKRAMVVRGPTDVRNRELIFLQFSRNETEEDFSAISYMIFAKFSDMLESPDKAAFMMDCERNYSMWTFSGGFRTWVKMSLVKTTGRGNESVEFRQESSVVKYIDKRPPLEQANELFFVVFQWRDPFIQQVKDIVTANAWNTIAILCGVFLALFKAADFAKLSIKWMIKIRKRHLRAKMREMSQIG
ncbi:proton-activated chloride channel isoform X1 [Myxocyprinus asiaticus]|uniref:proton-activated chloride channel isoform X1 n=2 Tax=Myxocyprinus asiaticus TaxID=70543 RepID=UPI002223E8FB|nr:proton-activated chloride channel isoform X1 [Myxocyprinus asiaticus]